MSIQQSGLDVHKNFHDIDTLGGGAELDTYLGAVHASPIWALSREARRAKALFRSGMRVLDAGCGSGHDLEWMVKTVGPEGLVVGFDFSNDLLERASQRAAAQNLTVELKQGDLHRLPFDDASFDVVWCERVLMYVDRPEVAAREIHRVLKPRGRFISGEIDMGSVFVVSPDFRVANSVAARAQRSIRHPLLARALSGHCYQAGFSSVVIDPQMLAGRDAEAWKRNSNAVFHLRELVEEGGLAADAADEWLAGIERIAANGEFVGVVTIVNLIATKT